MKKTYLIYRLYDQYVAVEAREAMKLQLSDPYGRIASEALRADDVVAEWKAECAKWREIA